jgi:HAE1 family hydrophobic/amphiphilic exporter-1
MSWEIKGDNREPHPAVLLVIPVIAVPVSLIGTLAFMLAFGFSIDILTLLGLVLAVALVVDDAIVVVENVMRKLEGGTTDLKQATREAIAEVRSPIVATTLVLIAVFVPVSFIPGMTGLLYNQFALTIAISVFLSGINFLTLSPALCAVFLRPE